MIQMTCSYTFAPMIIYDNEVFILGIYREDKDALPKKRPPFLDSIMAGDPEFFEKLRNHMIAEHNRLALCTIWLGENT